MIDLINGATSRVLYMGAIALIGIWLIGVFLLLSLTRGVPELLWVFPTPLVTFLLGAHIKPPISTDANGEYLASGQKAHE